ncbi:MAG: hypothetical protein AAGJ28_25720 [Pseudomonadota bacterium]
MGLAAGIGAASSASAAAEPGPIEGAWFEWQRREAYIEANWPKEPQLRSDAYDPWELECAKLCDWAMQPIVDATALDPGHSLREWAAYVAISIKLTEGWDGRDVCSARIFKLLGRVLGIAADVEAALG